MRTDDFDYNLPEELIAQAGVPCATSAGCSSWIAKAGKWRIASSRTSSSTLRPGDLLVANETRVMPARLLGAKRGTGGAAEVFLLRECEARSRARTAWLSGRYSCGRASV